MTAPSRRREFDIVTVVIAGDSPASGSAVAAWVFQEAAAVPQRPWGFGEAAAAQ